MMHRGFTLIELLLVITIIGVLSSLLLGGVMMAVESSRRTKTLAQIQQVTVSLESHRQMRGGYPDSAIRTVWIAALAAQNPELKLRDGEILDAWENPIEYRNARNFDGTYTIRSPAGGSEQRRYSFAGRAVPRPDSFWIWSNGKNEVGDPSAWSEPGSTVPTDLPIGGGDDLTNWK